MLRIGASSLVSDTCSKSTLHCCISSNTPSTQSSDEEYCVHSYKSLAKAYVLFASILRIILVPRLLTHICRLDSSSSRLRGVWCGMDLGGDANDTASRTSASVASLLGLLVSALAEVVGAGVNDDGALGDVRCDSHSRSRTGWNEMGGAMDEKARTYANNALGSDELDQLVLMAALSIALAVGLVVAQVTDVAFLVVGSTVGLVLGVDWCMSASATIFSY